MKYRFVDFIPEQIEGNIIYISIEHDTAMHLCACGCRLEVVTPLSPAQWSISYNGESISLSPSIGNWSFPCKSHYWIKNGRVEWAKRFSDEKIAAVKLRDKSAVKKLHAREILPSVGPGTTSGETVYKEQRVGRRGWLSRIRDFFR